MVGPHTSFFVSACRIICLIHGVDDCSGSLAHFSLRERRNQIDCDLKASVVQIGAGYRTRVMRSPPNAAPPTHTLLSRSERGVEVIKLEDIHTDVGVVKQLFSVSAGGNPNRMLLRVEFCTCILKYFII